jgi:uncharacterized phiE125 gp8 family phage protein
MIVYSRVTVAPASEPITLTEAKAWLKVDGTDDDALLTSLITAARIACENYAGLSFITQTRTVKLDRFCGDVILPYGPVASVTSVAYKKEDDTDGTINSSDYTLDIQSGLSKIRINEDGWPYTNRTLNNVVVTYVAGAGAATEIMKLGVKQKLAVDYEKRGDTNEESEAWMSTLDLIKVYWNAEV